jgi:orotidine-5'-phosphate decarboxylase
MSQFASHLLQRIRAYSPLCVGIDPSASLLKMCGLPDSPEGALAFGMRVLQSVNFQLSIIKPQSAFFERFGSAGMQALEELVRQARAREVLVLLDGKRGDIDSTAAAYGEGYFSPTTTLRVDAVTTHAYLGLGALKPLINLAVENEGGVFVVVRSSNPEGVGLQLARMSDGVTVARHLSAQITQINHTTSATLLGPIGAVVGATCEDADEIAAAMPASFILAPGVGAQGATMRDVKARMPSACGRVLPSVSRGILANGTSDDDIGKTIGLLSEMARELL